MYLDKVNGYLEDSVRDKRQKFYASSAWRRLRLICLSLPAQALCVHCMKVGKLTPATVADHIVSLTDDWSLRLTLSNLQGLCDECHGRKTAVERARYNGNIIDVDKQDKLNDFD